jgi:hypothetical protein
MKMALKIGSTWRWEKWYKNKLIKSWKDRNLCTLEGRNYAMTMIFSSDLASEAITTWHVLLFEDDYTPQSSDVYATPGFTECTAYDEALRPGFQKGAISGAIISNESNRASFTFNDSKTIYGGGIVGGGTDADTKGDTAGGGILFNASQFSGGGEPVVDDMVLKVSIEISLTDV